MKASTIARRAGALAFVFFFAKGLVWLALFAVAGLSVIQ